MTPFYSCFLCAVTKSVFCFIQAGALFVLPCTIGSILTPPPSQLSSRRWKEYMARKPRTIGGKQSSFHGVT